MPKVTEEHLEARRRQILAAALACFAREGFHRTTMQDIFREAELSPGAVYSYFKGKDEIVDAITSEAMRFSAEGARALAAAAAAGSGPTLGEAFEGLVHGFEQMDVGTYETRTRMAPQLWVEAQRNPVVRERASSGIGGMVDALAKVAAEAGHPDPAAAGRAAVALLMGMLVQRSIFGDAVDVDGYVATAKAMLDAGAA
jgi:TetR/AcrR family transcriptional regulator, transcriptional repressor of aconitase